MNKLNNKIIYSVLYIMLLALILSLILLYASKRNEKVIATYSINQAGQMRNESEISEETFDNYGNLTHYKYKMQLEDGLTVEKTYDIKYTFDNDKRITRVAYDNNYIDITYDSNNKISKLINFIQENELNKKYEYNFSYDNNVTKVISSKEYNFKNEEENYTINEKFTLTETNIHNEDYTLCFVSENNIEKQVYTYKKHDKEINYSNIFSLLDINFEGYFTVIPKLINSNFTIEIPVFNSEKLVSLEVKTNNPKTNFSYTNYYDKNGNILKCDTSLDKDTLYMYKNISNKGYTTYSLEINDDIANYLEYKDYLDNNVIVKREILVNKKILDNELEEMLNKFENYFEDNK